MPNILYRNDPIERLGLPIRIEHALRWGGVKSVGDFYDITSEKLLKIRNIGHRSINFLLSIKKRMNIKDNTEVSLLNNEDMTTSQPIQTKAPEIPNELLISRLLNHCRNDRLVEVIQKRYGLVNGEPETLEEIGHFYHITRERIRQLQKKALGRMNGILVQEKKPILKLIEDMLWQNGGIISEEEADKILPTIFKNLPYDGSSLLDLLADLRWIENHAVGDVRFYSPLLGNVKLSDLMEQIISVLKKHGVSDVENIIQELPCAKKLSADLIQSFVLSCCMKDPRIEEEVNGKFTIYTSYGTARVWADLMAQVLEDEGAPLHFTEIADRVNDLLLDKNKHLEHRRVHFILIDNPLFAHSGVLGMYGLTTWGFRKESTPILAKECIKRAGFPMHWEQIFYYISKFKNSSKLSVRNMLDTNSKFINKGNGFYGIRDLDASSLSNKL